MDYLIIKQYKALFKEEALKAIETELVIDKTEYAKIDEKFSLIYTLLSCDLPKDSEEKKTIIDKANELYADFIYQVKTAQYDLRLDKEEYLLLKKFILNEHIYGRDEILIGRDVKDNFFYAYDTEPNANRTAIYNVNERIFKVNMSMLSKLTYLLGFKKTKGLTSNESEKFCKIIDKFSLIGQVSNPLEDIKTSISNKMDTWRALGYSSEYNLSEEEIVNG